MFRINHGSRFATALVLIGFLSGCSAAEKVTGIFSEPIILPCPDYYIVADAAEIIQYREGNGRDLTDVDFEGQMSNMRISCLTRIDEETRVGEMDIEIAFDISATRGPANTTREAEFPYFYYVTNQDKKWLAREKKKVGVEFKGNRTRLSLRTETATVTVPLRPYVTNENYLIYGGFLLSEEQLQANRLRRQQRRN